MKNKNTKFILAFSLILLWFVILYLTREYKDLDETRYGISAIISGQGVYVILAYIFNWGMWFGGYKTPSMKEDPSDDNRCGRIFGLMAGIAFLLFGVWAMVTRF